MQAKHQTRQAKAKQATTAKSVPGILITWILPFKLTNDTIKYTLTREAQRAAPSKFLEAETWKEKSRPMYAPRDYTFVLPKDNIYMLKHSNIIAVGHYLVVIFGRFEGFLKELSRENLIIPEQSN